MTDVVLSWSGGKDAAMALYELQQTHHTTVVELLTTINEDRDRSTMHGVRRQLYDRQAKSIGLPIRYVDIPDGAGNEIYEERMAAAVSDYANGGVDEIVFADLHLEDVRAYREEDLSRTDVSGNWPLWGRDTDDMITALLDAGFRATLVCVDGAVLDPSVLGCDLSESLLEDMPDEVDPCGENGEFHTFVYDGPIFDETVAFETGNRVDRDLGRGTYHYIDLVCA